MKNNFLRENKITIYVAVFLVVLIVIFLWQFINILELKVIAPSQNPQEPINQESEIQYQIRELEELRSQNSTQTEGDVKIQTDKLETLRKEAQSLPKTQIEEQVNEINKLRLKQ